ncbi:G-patch-domain-containing protein [Microthyrium microscopicum]|uniref:G-patch-domain-containing protein n=1 Tax=Microthyrium microscopicum TaxID=703497 RepID=A0A6A6UV32_9PEZI|nr:G-patch-domain-containing protein [Microthyrium microscopicum]
MAPKKNNPTSGGGGNQEDAEDDYMNMTFAEPETKIETSVQKAARRKKEGELRGRVKSKQEREEEETRVRDAALSKSLDSSNKGFKMLSKLGYKPGTALGKTGSGVAEPITVTIKDDKGGIGRDSERKRKLEHAVESASKRARETAEEYRDRVRAEHEEKRRQGQLFGAQKIAEKFDVQADEEDDAEGKGETINPNLSKLRLLSATNVLWRGIARERLLKERERRMRHDLLQSGPRLGTFEDPDENEDDKLALGNRDTLAEEELEVDDDEELAEFESLPVEDRLLKVVEYLRGTHHYCFWCKFEYPDKEMEGCPGPNEDDHD